MARAEGAMGNNSGSQGGDLDSIKADLASLKENVMAMGQSMMDKGKGAAGDMKERMGGAVSDRMSQFNDQVKGVSDKGRQALDYTKDTMQDRPLMALGISMGLGILVGAMLFHGGKSKD